MTLSTYLLLVSLLLTILEAHCANVGNPFLLVCGGDTLCCHPVSLHALPLRSEDIYTWMQCECEQCNDSLRTDRTVCVSVYYIRSGQTLELRESSFWFFLELQDLPHRGVTRVGQIGHVPRVQKWQGCNFTKMLKVWSENVTPALLGCSP